MAPAQRTYVLVHGAWHGGWVWRDVAPALAARGHRVTTPTLTGLGERRHTLNREVDLDTHVEDIVAHIEMNDLGDVDLVGWSYGGMVTTGVLARVPERIRSMIYLDAFVPENGKALADYVDPDTRTFFEQARAADQTMPSIPFEVFGVKDPKAIEFIAPRLVNQSWRTFFQPAKAPARRPDIPYTYVRCLGFDPSPFIYFHGEMKKDPKVRTFELDTSHTCMVTDPKSVIGILAEAP
ncbi:MAG TPA: alpha/beta fold hydrolase [Xanthobacteraceae bacterium]|nr:alpha/beta fold hydrolase [Xanthobacteraceae bacterium]